MLRLKLGSAFIYIPLASLIRNVWPNCVCLNPGCRLPSASTPPPLHMTDMQDEQIWHFWCDPSIPSHEICKSAGSAHWTHFFILFTSPYYHSSLVIVWKSVSTDSPTGSVNTYFCHATLAPYIPLKSAWRIVKDSNPQPFFTVGDCFQNSLWPFTLPSIIMWWISYHLRWHFYWFSQ